MMTLEEMEKAIRSLEAQIRDLKVLSDTNDCMLLEMVNNLTVHINQILGISEEDVGGPYFCQRD